MMIKSGNFWKLTNQAIEYPLEGDLSEIYYLFDSMISQTLDSKKLEVAASGILLIAKLLQQRSEWLLQTELSGGVEMEPEFDFSSVLRQTMRLDFSDLEQPLPAPKKHGKRKEAVLQEMSAQLCAEIEKAVEAAEKKSDPTKIAHSEDIGAWAARLDKAFLHAQGNTETITFIHLLELTGLQAVELWMALVWSGNYALASTEDEFYHSCDEALLVNYSRSHEGL
jgi:chromatin segregation and condensation protein Rec8/ScpA/Scc1 (kleisin family)